MDETDMSTLKVAAQNNNSSGFGRNILTIICGQLRRFFNAIRSVFCNTCTDNADGTSARPHRRLINLIRNTFRRIRNAYRRNRPSNVTQTRSYPLYNGPKFEVQREYNMNHKHRGLAVIFNQEFFENHHEHSRRLGTDVDLDNLIKTFERLEFKVMPFTDLRRKDLARNIKKVASMDHSKSDCIVITVLTHGEHNKLFSHDEAYSLSLITSFFTDEKCPSLKGKPRIFLIQSCRGLQKDPGHKLKNSSKFKKGKNSKEGSDVTAYGITHGKSDSDEKEPEEMVHNPPNHPDFLIVRSAMPHYVSFRNTTSGSWFISELCAELNENGHEYDILTLLTFANQSVSLRESTDEQAKQILCSSTMLTKLLYFRPKKPN